MAKTLEDAGSKNVSNTALGLGIAGTALGLGFLGGKGNGLLGGLFGQTSGEPCGPSAWEAWQKEANDNIELTRGIYDMRIKDLEEKQGIYNYFNGKFCALEKQVFALEAAKPYEAEISALRGKLAHAYTNEKFTEAINYANRLDCRNMKGELVLPSTPTITGYGLPACQGPHVISE